MDARDVYLWEEPNQPIYIKADESLAANPQILYVIYSYSAFTAGRQANGGFSDFGYWHDPAGPLIGRRRSGAPDTPATESEQQAALLAALLVERGAM
jgi:hypothetical protein